MASTKAARKEKDAPKTERKRTFLQGETHYEIFATEKESGDEVKLSTAKTPAAAQANFEACQSLGAKTHENFLIKKVAIVSIANGQLTE